VPASHHANRHLAMSPEDPENTGRPRESGCRGPSLERAHFNVPLSVPRVIQRPTATHARHRVIIAEPKSARPGCIMPEWSRPFEDPITLPDGRTLSMLEMPATTPHACRRLRRYLGNGRR